MAQIEFVRFAVLAVFALDALALFSLIVGKAVHRRVVEGREARRSQYLSLLSRHLAAPGEVLRLDDDVANDPAFLSAVIDIRNAVIGPEADTLGELVDHYGVAEVAARKLRRGFFLTRRLEAAVVLAELADQSSAHVLMEHLTDPHPAVRIQAARGLGRMGWTPAIDVIVERLGAETPWVRSQFADTLVGFGSRATWPLVAFVRVNHRFESDGPATAIRTLATIGDDRATTPLVELLGEADDPEILIAIVESLGLLGSPLAIPSLRSFGSSDDWRLRAKAATALGEIGDPAALGVLVPGLSDQNWWVRRNSAAAMASLPGGIVLLYEALDSPDPFARDAAAEALADAGELLHARDRVSAGVGSTHDRILVDLVETAVMP